MRTAKRRRIRDLSLGLGALVAAVLTVAAIVWINIDFLEAADRSDTEAREELAWAAALMDAASDQENALRGLDATGDPRFIAPFREGQTRFDQALERLTALSLDDTASQHRDIAEVTALARRWTVSYAAPAIAAVQSGRSLLPVNRPSGRETSAIRRALDDLRDQETRLLHQRDQAQIAAYGETRLALILGSAAALAFTLLILGATARQLITERRLAEQSAEQLREALERAHAAEWAKTRFLANMSHEMRTPLNGVAGMTEVLAKTKLDSLQRELVDSIRFSSVTLDHLIEDLLCLSRDGSAGRAAHAETSFRLGAAVRAAARPFSSEAQDKGLEFAIEVDAAAEASVVGGAQRLGQLLACLLSNAVKFTDRGAVTLSVRGLGKDRYIFEVADTGVGFAPSEKARLFETFGQRDDSDTRRHGGAGLGLALANRLVVELGGTLDARSTPGLGSVFSFEIELAAGEGTGGEADRAAGCEDVDDRDEEAVRLLIVDDNPTNRKVLELVLDQVGVEWVSVENGLQAVEAAGRQVFSAILMDIQMPVMDGLTATREIRRIEREAGRSAAPVIIVSANCQPEHVEAGLSAGAQRHLGKPVSAQALIDALNEVLAQAPQAA